MNILICDDVYDDALELMDMIHKLQPDANIIISNSAQDALSYICSDKMPHVCFLDIIMPGMNGFSLAEQMRETGYYGHIVFLTISSDFAVKSYKVKAFSYLLKPAQKSEVAKVMQELSEAIEAADTQGIPIKTKKLAVFILFKDLSYVEVIRRKVHFHLTNGEEIAINATLSTIAPKLLADSRFIQCHGSFVLNMDDIKAVTGACITMQSGVKIPVSRKFIQTKDKMIKWMFEEDPR